MAWKSKEVQGFSRKEADPYDSAMETFKMAAVPRALGPVLDLVQLEKVPVTVTRRNRPAIVFVPMDWYARAVAEVNGPAPEDGPPTVDELRAQYAELMRRVQFDGAHVRIRRHGGPAGVAVPVDWYEQAKTVLEPAGASPPAESENS
ncbi:prevent-host-death family protein [Kitasatospora sp. MAP12-15]|uniref:type II toxin-antitoxin system prevent-host-death family antitoxin n=1 Tax=unclassified Kitasatospora TaxID=2633591 RepID=UPI002475BA91|nr:type II toxin-antitoxin system prevent-host-death family antitoxin [Kitasatospora sp. MAP12-44]MDH6110183.1 prevent-host-death family protein [Kitasatospora sp. MAP12-44]